MSFAVAVVALMQANTAIPDPAQRLEPGRWIMRTTVERGTGRGGVSASLKSNDLQYRLVVRCDYSYAGNISIQFMREVANIPVTALPVRLMREPDKLEITLEWEETAAGVFARDGDFDPSASVAAGFLLNYHGELHVTARNQADQAISAVFDAAAGHAAIRQVIDRCKAMPSE